MARVMIACPDTGRPIYTGVSYDEVTFESSQLADKSVFCPECEQVHTWNKQDAYLESEGGCPPTVGGTMPSARTAGPGGHMQFRKQSPRPRNLGSSGLI